jgi:hypothetical protein
MDIIDIPFDTSSMFADDWLQKSYSNPPRLGQSCDNSNDLDMYNPLDPWDFNYLDQFGTERYQSSSANLCNTYDDYFLTNAYTITPTIEETPALSPARTNSSPTPSPIPTTKRGRGRPRTSARKDSSTSSNYSSPINKSIRTPHNQVERKYREGLNSEMERLRLAIPATARWDSASSSGSSVRSPKASKAMVLASAIEYIREVERQRDVLLSENRELKR